MILLQTLVMSVILSMMAVMVLKWIMGRYMMAARNYRSTTTRGRAMGYYQDRFANWNWNTTGMPALSQTTITESYPSGTAQQVCVRSLGNGKFQVTSDQDTVGGACP